MEGFSQKQHWEVTQGHLNTMKDEIAEGAPLRDELIARIGKDKAKDEILQTEEMGPNWEIKSRSVEEVRKGILENIRLSVRLMAEGKAECTDEKVRKLLTEVDVIKSIENNADAIAMRETLEKLLNDLKKENV